MDLVPRDFSERVSATWKCCDDEEYHCGCIVPEFSGRTWTFRKVTEVQLNIALTANGDCRYEFRLTPSQIVVTMSELLKHPDCKQLRIKNILVNDYIDGMKPATDVGMEKLLNFVSFLANEPHILFYSEITSSFDSPQGSMLLNWLEEQCFSSIRFRSYHSIYSPILQTQFTRRIPTAIRVNGSMQDPAFIADQLSSGELTRFSAPYCFFSADVMEAIVQSFLRTPSKKKVDIDAHFDESTEAQLLQLEEQGVCERDAEGKFIFQNQFHRLVVSPLSQHSDFWTCVSV